MMSRHVTLQADEIFARGKSGNGRKTKELTGPYGSAKVRVPLWAGCIGPKGSTHSMND